MLKAKLEGQSTVDGVAFTGSCVLALLQHLTTNDAQFTLAN